MTRFLRALGQVLTPSDRRQFVLLLMLAAVTASLQVVAVASILPFVSVLLDPGAIAETPGLATIYSWSGVDSPQAFVVLTGVAVLALLLLGNGALAFDLWLSLRFGFHLEHRLACRLLEGYLHLPWEEFRRRDTAELSKNVLTESERAAVGTVLASVGVFNDLMMAVFLGLLLLVVDPWITLSTLAVLGVAYTLIYGLLQGQINTLGAEFPTLHADKLRKAQEALHGFREIKVAGRQSRFVGRYAMPSWRSAENSVRYRLLELLPVLLLETVAFATLLVVAIVAALRSDGISDVIPIIALYGFAAYRLVPAVKEVFSGVANLRYHFPAFEALAGDLARGRALQSPSPTAVRPGDIEFVAVTYRHRQQSAAALESFDLTIRAGERLCVAGPSGAGKSTFLDLLLGLLVPEQGQILVGGEPLDAARRLTWQQQIGFVPQAGLLLEDTVTRNIAFGIDDEEIDLSRVMSVARIAQIHAFIQNELPLGYATVLQGDGLRLSGGQQQRILIARALYRDPSILVFDEASSALDQHTEASLLKALQGLTGKTLIFVSHKAAIAAWCDRVAVIDRGQPVATGTFTSLTAEGNPWREFLLQSLEPPEGTA